jgi:hypothetical protein
MEWLRAAGDASGPDDVAFGVVVRSANPRTYALACAIAAACSKHSEKPRTDPPSVAREDAAPAQLTLDDRQPLNHGKARMADGELVVRMSNEPEACGFALDVSSTRMLSIEIPPGPGGRFFAGIPVGVRAYGFVDGSRVDYLPAETVARLQPFEPLKGAKISGTIELPRGGGAFEAELCELGRVSTSLPEEASDRPAAGILDGRAFEPRKAFIELEKDPTRLDWLRVYQDEGLTCANAAKSSKKPALALDHIGGASARRPLVGSTQPAWAGGFHVPLERAYFVGRMPAWVRFERLSFEPGAKVTGSLAIQRQAKGEPTTRVSRRFEAEVCPR